MENWSLRSSLTPYRSAFIAMTRAINTTLDQAFYDISNKKQLPLPENLQIVTLGAAIHFPKEFTNAHQFIGALDGFGALNSQEVVDWDNINGLWHTLNSNIPGHLSVDEALDMAGIRD